MCRHMHCEKLEDGSVQITAVDIKPTSCGWKRFGQGTKEWPKFPIKEESIKKFYMQVKSRFSSHESEPLMIMS